MNKQFCGKKKILILNLKWQKHNKNVFQTTWVWSKYHEFAKRGLVSTLM